MEAEYYTCCTPRGHLQLSATDDPLADFPKPYADHIDSIINQIWNSKQPKEADDALLINYANSLSKGVEISYSQERGIDNATDKVLLYVLKTNVWQFSAAKTYTQLKQMSLALIDPKTGSIRSFEDFKRQAQTIAGTHLNWLRTEYDTAVQGALMTAKWQNIQAQKHLYPYLQFVAVEDDVTSEICRALDGTIAHVDDDFWKKYYPPVHFNCRSTVKQLTETQAKKLGYRAGETSKKEKEAQATKEKAFHHNVGETLEILPKTGLYFPKFIQKIIDKHRHKFPYDLQFNVLWNESKMRLGFIRKHFLADDKAKDYKTVLAIASDVARKKPVIVDVMPNLDPDKYSDLRKIIFPDAKDRKSADLRIDGLLWEVEEIQATVLGKNTIKHAISAGAKQADNVFLVLKHDISRETLGGLAIARFKDHKELKNIVFVYQGNYIQFDRKWFESLKK